MEVTTSPPSVGDSQLKGNTTSIGAALPVPPLGVLFQATMHSDDETDSVRVVRLHRKGEEELLGDSFAELTTDNTTVGSDEGCVENVLNPMTAHVTDFNVITSPTVSNACLRISELLCVTMHWDGPPSRAYVLHLQEALATDAADEISAEIWRCQHQLVSCIWANSLQKQKLIRRIAEDPSEKDISVREERNRSLLQEYWHQYRWVLKK